jgi:hypothetical protein
MTTQTSAGSKSGSPYSVREPVTIDASPSTPPSKGGGTLRMIRAARSYMLRLSNDRQQNVAPAPAQRLQRFKLPARSGF